MKRVDLIFTNVSGTYVSQPIEMLSSSFILHVSLSAIGTVQIKHSAEKTPSQWNYIKDSGGVDDLVLDVLTYEEFSFTDGKFGLWVSIELSVEGQATMLL
jgi:hypothetical protein